MKVFLVVLSCLALGQAQSQVQVTLPFQNPAGVRFTGHGFYSPYAAQLQQQGAEQAQAQAQFQQQNAEQAQAQAQFQQQNAEQAQAQAQLQQQNAEQAQAQAQQAAEQPQEAPQPLQAEEPRPVEAVAEQPQQPQQRQYQYQQQHAVQYHHQPIAAVAPAAHLQYHRAIAPAPAAIQYAAPVHQKVAYAAAPAVAVHQKIGYASTPVLTKVHGVADVPVTKLAYSQGFTQKEVDVAHPAVTTRKVKVRRPALRKDFYDIEHRVIVRPAGSATLELSQPISKEQNGPTVFTPTKFAHFAPVVRYGASRQIIDGEGSSASGLAYLRNSAPAQAQAAQPQSAPAPEQPAAAPRSAEPAPETPQPAPEQQAEPRQAVDQDTEVIEAARDDRPAEAPAQQQQQQEQQQQQSEPAPAPQEQQQPEAAPAPAPAPEQPQAPLEKGRKGLTITPDMPLELQSRLLELLTAKGGTVTEILNKDGTPADSASVLQVTDALGDPSLQGGERITTRRIVVTRPIETIQEIEVQEPATKIQRHLVQQPTLFKHKIPAVARVPYAVPAIKHVATPVVKSTYHHAAPGAFTYNFGSPAAQFQYTH